jgi:hypothetical protein
MEGKYQLRLRGGKTENKTLNALDLSEQKKGTKLSQSE